MLEHVKYNTFENDKMELFNNFKKNDIPKEKKTIQNFYFIQAEYMYGH